jgi:hypothetical protein
MLTDATVVDRDEIRRELQALFDAEDMDGEEIVGIIEEWLDGLDDDDRREAVVEAVRVQAADEGCRWPDLEDADLAGIRKVANWEGDDLGDVLLDSVAELADAAIVVQIAGLLARPRAGAVPA